MVDITKDEFWNEEYEKELKNSTRVSFWKKMIKKHKFLSICLIGFAVFTIIDFILIYEFFSLLKTL